MRSRIENYVNLCRELHGQSFPRNKMEKRFLLDWICTDVCARKMKREDVTKIVEEILEK